MPEQGEEQLTYWLTSCVYYWTTQLESLCHFDFRLILILNIQMTSEH